jgi:hypothetical protein
MRKALTRVSDPPQLVLPEPNHSSKRLFADHTHTHTPALMASPVGGLLHSPIEREQIFKQLESQLAQKEQELKLQEEQLVQKQVAQPLCVVCSVYSYV